MENSSYKVAILSDTHGYLPESARKIIESSDIVIHAGDIGSMELLVYLNEKKAYCVAGNADDGEIRGLLGEMKHFKIGKVRFFLVHDAGPFPYYNAAVAQALKRCRVNVLVCGHTHIAKIQKNLTWKHLYVNPGACGNFGPHVKKTMILMDVGATINNIQLIELED